MPNLPLSGGWNAPFLGDTPVSFGVCQISPVCTCCRNDNRSNRKKCKVEKKLECRTIFPPRLWLYNNTTGEHEWKSQGGSIKVCLPKYQVKCS